MTWGGPKKVLGDIYRAYQVDGWEFIEIWGKKSWGKTTVALASNSQIKA